MCDWVPGLSQIKSAVQLLCLDPEGAAQTQRNFVRKCPVVSQVTSGVYLLSNNVEEAKRVQSECLGTLSDMADGLPAVGHVKGVVHYACGDRDGGDKAMKSASRTTGVIAGGVAGMVLGGPIGAVAGGISGGAYMDTLTTAIDSHVHGEFRGQGYIQAVKNVADDIDAGKNPAGSLFEACVAPVADGALGYASGRATQSWTESAKGTKSVKVSGESQQILRSVELTEQEIRQMRPKAHLPGKSVNPNPVNPDVVFVATKAEHTAAAGDADKSGGSNSNQKTGQSDKGKKSESAKNNGNDSQRNQYSPTSSGGGSADQDGNDPKSNHSGKQDHGVPLDLDVIEKFCRALGVRSLDDVSIRGTFIFINADKNVLKFLKQILNSIPCNSQEDFNFFILSCKAFAESCNCNNAMDFIELLKFILQFVAEEVEELESTFQKIPCRFTYLWEKALNERLRSFRSKVLRELRDKMAAIVDRYKAILSKVRGFFCHYRFRNDVAAASHYFKHCNVGSRVLTVEEYLDLVQKLSKKALNTPEGVKFQRIQRGRLEMVFEVDGVKYKIALKYIDGIIVSTLFHLSDNP